MKNNFLRIYKKLYSFYGPQDWWPAKTSFEIIVGAILTQNTSWSNVEKAITVLREGRMLTPRSIQKTDIVKLAKAIRPCGYFNQKAKRLKNFTGFLFCNYAGSLHKMFKEKTSKLRKLLLEINGIGEETADSILLYAGKKPVFVVDAYTRRIFTRHKMLKEKDDYSTVQKNIMSNLETDVQMFNEYHALIVALGKSICLKRNPICEKCPLSKINI